MGSVKDLTIIEDPTLERAGKGSFSFSDRFSVFDWGEMPQQIVNKGRAICIIGAYFFEKLQEQGFKTHYLGVVENGEVKKLDDLNEPADTMQVKIVRVVKPKLIENTYDYSQYKNEKANMLIPLEVIYRNQLPEGASVFKRLKNGSVTLQDLGLETMPFPGQTLSSPITDVSTKLEVTDRYITWEEAAEISALNDIELQKVKDTILSVNRFITNQVSGLDIVNVDGKIELGFDENREIIIVDVLGTPDECRFRYEGIPLSKEIARIYYRNTPWYEDVNEAKKKDRLNWKEHVKSAPPLMPARLSELVSMVYQSFCNELTGRNWFDVPELKEIMSEVNGFVK
jgi:phosphoribosylaminoimidazole-succinocarboxamide synthase